MTESNTIKSSKETKPEPLHPEEVVTSVYLIRHGHTEATEQGMLYTDPEVALTESGRLQAAKAGQWLMMVKPEVLLSSTSKRVWASAEIIGEAIGLPPNKVHDLNEWNVGSWDGRKYIDIKATDPELYKAWSLDPVKNRPPGGESIADVVERVGTRLEELIAEHPGKKIALVSHAGIIRALIVRALGMPVENFWRVNIPTGSITKIDFSANFATMHMMAIRP
ncbi:MAG: histidine phosphatase family protein [Candidatus Obscuribacterales bacterium]|nr:histidine phosphatase family protein [Candidatus Obscuribacterales bacterium]